MKNILNQLEWMEDRKKYWNYYNYLGLRKKNDLEGFN